MPPTYLPHLKVGNDRRTVVQNALAMIRQGWGKSEAIEMALRAAGYRRSPASQLPRGLIE